ncbi:MAG: hypothetical protein OSB02_03280 [Rhodospirillaceae bacterium]|jgi:hypothetical protein|nr:hypothetical protein [Rhodospirillaceae bacterium]
MIDTKETARALYGLWRLARWDEEAFSFFNATEQGFWRSFAAAAFVAPLQALYQLSLYLTLDDPPLIWRVAAIESIEYIILWTLFPLSMLYVVKLLERETEFFRYIVAYNWFQLAVGYVAMPFVILSQFQLLPVQVSGFFDSLIFVTYVTFAAFIARVGLKVGMGASAGIVVIDILLTLMVGQVTLRMLT